MFRNYFYKDVLPFSAMVTVECTNVVLNILLKAATMKGMSNYAFDAYSYAVSTLVLLPFAFFFTGTTGLPPLKQSLLYRIFLLGVLGSVGTICGYEGVEYSSATLASAMSNLTPAFTFVLAVIFRMEKLALRSSNTQAKIMGTVISISGALVAFYLLLSVEYLLFSMWYIVQTQVMKIYPSEIVVVFLCVLCGTVISVPLYLIAETNLSAWRLKPDITLVAIVYSHCCPHLGLALEGPVYISIFKPLSISIAAAMGVIFLGDALYLGSVVGAVIISTGFYVAIWGIAKEEEMSEDCGFGNFEPSSTDTTPLLQKM